MMETNTPTIRKPQLEGLSFMVLLSGLLLAYIGGGLVWRGNATVQVSALAYFSLLFAGYLFWRGRTGSPRLVRTPVDGAVLLAVLALGGLWVLSPGARQGFGRMGLLLGYLTVFYLLLDAFDAGLKRKAVLPALLVSSGILMFMAALEVYTAYQGWFAAAGPDGGMPPFAYRLLSILGHANAFIALMNLVAPLAVVLLIKSKPAARFGAGLWLGIYLALIPFTSSRGGWLGMGVWVLALAGLLLSQGHVWNRVWNLLSRRKVLYGLLGLVIFAAAVPLAAALWQIFSAHPSHGAGGLFNSRTVMWQNSIEIWLNNPFIGTGIGRYALAYLDASQSIPPAYWPSHGHNLFLTTLAETGLTGLAALGILIISLALAALRVFRTAPQSERRFVAAALAGLAAFLFQNIADDFSSWWSIMGAVVLLLAWIFSEHSSGQPRWQGVHMGIMWLPAVMLLAGSAWTTWAYLPLADGVRAVEAGNAGMAAGAIDLAADRDSNFAYVQAQSGLAWAVYWEQQNDSSALLQASQRFSRSLELEPAPALWWANLAVTEWFSGEHTLALYHVQNAKQRSPREASFPLNHGWFLESAGQHVAAQREYVQALQIKPAWATHPFWRTSYTRREALGSWLASGGVIPASETPAVQAAIAARQNDVRSAELLLAEARWRGETYTRILLAEAALAEVQGNPETAIDNYLEAARLTDRRTLSPDSFVTAYPIVHFRQGLPYDLVPGYVRLESDYGQFDAIDHLHGLLMERGECELAYEVWQIWQRQVHGGAIETLLPAPRCDSGAEVQP